jgi:hypothetical protein
MRLLKKRIARHRIVSCPQLTAILMLMRVTPASALVGKANRVNGERGLLARYTDRNAVERGWEKPVLLVDPDAQWEVVALD